MLKLGPRLFVGLSGIADYLRRGCTGSTAGRAEREMQAVLAPYP